MIQRIASSALTDALKLAVGECAEMVDIDPRTADYRVFHIGIEATPAGGETLTFELYRQGHGFERRLFNVLSLTLGHCDADGLCPVESFSSSTGASPNDLPRLLPELARIAASLREEQRPADMLVLPFLSRSAQILWTKALVEGSAS